MKLLYLAFAGSDQHGVQRKLAEQARGLRALGVELDTLVFTEAAGARPPGAARDQRVAVPGGGFGVPGRQMACDYARDAIRRLDPDVVYLRYPVYDASVCELVQAVPPVVIELQTIYANEAHPAAAEAEAHWAARLLPATSGLVAVTGEILAAERARAGWDIPGLVMPNGADPATIPFVTPALAPGRIDLLCVASFHPWHGIDRLLVGMAMEPDVRDVHLHLIGDGPLMPVLRTLALEAGLTDRVHFHGPLAPSVLASWYQRAHVAIGSLAPHRVGLRELAALKHREYALSGLPMVIGGHDADFPSTLPWLRAFPADDSPVSPRTVRALALGWSAESRRRQIRTWAERQLAWSVKLPGLVAFLDDCARRGRPAESAA